MKRLLNNLSLRSKLIFIIMFCSFCAILLNNLFIFGITAQDYKKIKTTSLYILADVITDNSAAALQFSNIEVANKILQTVTADASIHYAALLNENCQPFVAYQSKSNHTIQQASNKITCKQNKSYFETINYLHLTTPIMDAGQQIGTLYIKSSLLGLNKKLTHLLQLYLVLFLMTLLITLILTLILQTYFLKPINNLLIAIRHITEHRDYSIQVHSHTHDELALLANEFNIMIEKINHHDMLLSQHNQLLEQTVEQRTHELQVNLKQLKLAKERAENADQAKSDFLAHMSHDLRTPLNGLLGYVQILQRKKDFPTKFLNEINIIDQSGQYLLSIVNDLLDLTKIETNKLELSPQTFNTLDFFNPIIQIFSNQAQKKNIEFQYDIDDQLPAALYGDENRLKRIISNLLENAFKFTTQGYIKLSINYKHALFISIEDSGCGINDENLQAIFEPFNQFSRFTNNDGVGLGLYITKYLVNLMGGSLSIDSQINKGTQCLLSLPLRTSQYIPADFDKYESVIGYHGDLITVLLVDDTQNNLDVLEAMLKPLDFKVISVTSGIACLECLVIVKPDIILLDMVMPVLNGIETCRRIRDTKLNKNPKIIMITANAFAEDRKNCLAAGCDDFLAKPVLLHNLLDIFQTQFDLQWLYHNELNNKYTVNSHSLNILIAEDNEICRLLMKHCLDEIGAQVTFAKEGEQALQLIQHLSFDCIILDLKMPYKTGFEVAHFINAHETPNKHSYLVAMSALINKKITAQAIEAGFHEIIDKPIEVRELTKLVDKVYKKVSTPSRL